MDFNILHGSNWQMASKKNILITGGAGFIGSHLIDFLMVTDEYSITCVDNFNDFYDPELKRKILNRTSVIQILN